MSREECRSVMLTQQKINEKGCEEAKRKEALEKTWMRHQRAQERTRRIERGQGKYKLVEVVGSTPVNE